MIPRHVKQYQLLICVCVLIGGACGIITFLLDKCLSFLALHIFTFLNPDSSNLLFILLPVIGILLSVLFASKIVGQNLSDGSERIRAFLASKHYDMPPSLTWAPAAGAVVTLGFGGSAGAEGPSAFVGAAIGSNFGRLFRFNNSHLRILIGIGAGAGIAGIFRSPIGGVLFTLEVLRMPLTTIPVIGLIVAALVAGVTSFLLSGQQYEVVMLDSATPELSELPWIIILGIICGLYSLYYTFVMHHAGERLKALSNPWLRGSIAGIIIGACIFLFPTLYSTGYGSLGQLLNGHTDTLYSYSLFQPFADPAALHSSGETPLPLHFPGCPLSDLLEIDGITALILIAAGTALLKALACAATNHGGGISGNFAPTLFAGGFVGFVFASALNHFCGFDLHVANYVYLGMAGAMSGIIQAPLMAMFLTAEMSGHSNFLWPLAIVSIISWLIAFYLPRTHFPIPRISSRSRN